MRKIFGLAAISAIFAFAAAAETYNGRLVDASCATQGQVQSQDPQGQPGQHSQPARPGRQADRTAACDPTSSTTNFALASPTGKMYRLDDAGNSKVIEAMKGRADRQKDPSISSTTGVMARITGTLEGNVLRVETVQVQ